MNSTRIVLQRVNYPAENKKYHLLQSWMNQFGYWFFYKTTFVQANLFKVAKCPNSNELIISGIQIWIPLLTFKLSVISKRILISSFLDDLFDGCKWIWCREFHWYYIVPSTLGKVKIALLISSSEYRVRSLEYTHLWAQLHIQILISFQHKSSNLREFDPDIQIGCLTAGSVTKSWLPSI